MLQYVFNYLDSLFTSKHFGLKAFVLHFTNQSKNLPLNPSGTFARRSFQLNLTKMLVLSIILCTVAVLGLWLWSAFRAAATFWQKRGFDAVGSDALNIFTIMANRLLQHEVDHNIYNHAKSSKKPFVGVMEFSKPILYVTDLDLARQVFIKDFDNFINRRKFEFADSKTDPIISKMLVFMEGEPWREMRAKMSPTFTTGKIRRMFEIFHTLSTELVEHLQNEAGRQPDQVINFQDAYERYTMGVIASAAFGVDAKTFQKQESIFQKMGRKLQLEIRPLTIIKFICMTAAPRLARALGFSLFEKEPETFFTNVIKSAVEHRQKSGDVREDFLQLMLEARSGQLRAVEESELGVFEKEAGIKSSNNISKDRVMLTELTDNVIVAQSLLFILAGFDTTQTLLLFAVYELALNPEVQEPLSEEIEYALENNGGNFSYDLVTQLEYLDKVINETLRKYPPLPRLERESLADYKIPGTELVIPKDTLVGIPTYSIHHDEEHFPDPERFDPERFSTEAKSVRHPYAFQPFGHGPRNCIGMRFAVTNAKMAIANIVHNFVLEPTAKTLIPMKFTRHTSLKPESMLLKLRARK